MNQESISPIGKNGEKILLTYARMILEAASGKKRIPEPVISKEEGKKLQKKRGGFITLVKADGSLRGCIGVVEPIYTTLEMVRRMTVSSSQNDPRFSPVENSEVDSLSIEISLLEEPLLLNSLDEIIIGRDGLIVEKGQHKGLLLPQVALERGWDAQTFFKQTLVKAGLSLQKETFDTVKKWYFPAYHFGE